MLLESRQNQKAVAAVIAIIQVAVKMNVPMSMVNVRINIRYKRRRRRETLEKSVLMHMSVNQYTKVKKKKFKKTRFLRVCIE